MTNERIETMVDNLVRLAREYEAACRLGEEFRSGAERRLEAAKAALSARVEEVEPTDAMIEAGCEAMHKMHAAMRDRNLSDEPENMDDFDEGDVCRAVYLAMRSTLAKEGSPNA